MGGGGAGCSLIDCDTCGIATVWQSQWGGGQNKQFHDCNEWLEIKTKGKGGSSPIHPLLYFPIG